MQHLPLRMRVRCVKSQIFHPRKIKNATCRARNDLLGNIRHSIAESQSLLQFRDSVCLSSRSLIAVMNSAVPLGLILTILVIANVNPGLAQLSPLICCRLQLPCCHFRDLEREPSAARQRPPPGVINGSPRSNMVSL